MSMEDTNDFRDHEVKFVADDRVIRHASLAIEDVFFFAFPDLQSENFRVSTRALVELPAPFML